MFRHKCFQKQEPDCRSATGRVFYTKPDPLPGNQLLINKVTTACQNSRGRNEITGLFLELYQWHSHSVTSHGPTKDVTKCFSGTRDYLSY